MTIALTAAIGPTRRLFLGVERSACGRAWRDRLDERGAARALAITQRHDDVPELLARILAGRGIEVDAVAGFLDPTVRALMPDPDSLADMRAAAVRGGIGSMSAVPPVRSRLRNATMTCPSFSRAFSPGAGSRWTRSQASSIRPCAR